MCGQESAKKEQQKCASLKELWILDRTLIPFIDNAYPAIHRFMQDNDPKHTSVYAADLMVDKSINWWKTSAESPNLNTIENFWHEQKEFIGRETKQ